MIRFSEKGGKEMEIPVHHKLEELLDRYLEISGLRNRVIPLLVEWASMPGPADLPENIKALARRYGP